MSDQKPVSIQDDSVERLLSCAIDLKIHVMKQKACHSLLESEALLSDVQEAINDVKSHRLSNNQYTTNR